MLPTVIATKSRQAHVETDVRRVVLDLTDGQGVHLDCMYLPADQARELGWALMRHAASLGWSE